MDVLNPEVVWIDGMCFRKLKIKDSEKYASKPMENERAIIKLVEDDDCYSDLQINMKNNTYFATFHVPKQMMGFLIGKEHATRKSIENQSGAKMILNYVENNKKNEPLFTNEELKLVKSEDIVITGSSKESVGKACRRIQSILFNARWRVGDYTHFISIPVNDYDIRNGFIKFKKEVLLNCKASDRISEHLFVKPGSLHLTIVMLTLFNNRERESAKEILMSYKSEILERIKGEPFRIEVKGVEYMNDDPAEIDVLYGKVAEISTGNSLQLIADKLSDAFAENNFARKQGDVKLHVTLMKSREGPKGQRQTFDARKILAEYGEYSFGRMDISEIHISIRFTADHDTGYYKSSFVLTLEN